MNRPDEARSGWTRRARFLVAALVACMAGIWLNGCAVFFGIGASGGPALGQPFLLIMYLACAPTYLLGIRPDKWAGSGVDLIALNVLGWTLAGVFLAGGWELLRRHVDHPVQPAGPPRNGNQRLGSPRGAAEQGHEPDEGRAPEEWEDP